MKKSQVGKGRFYSDGKTGVREVLDEGSQYKLYQGVEDDDCLLYRCLYAKSKSDIGKERNSTRTSFAAWAKSEIPSTHIEAHLLALQAAEIAGKLTEPQRAFLRSFDSDLSEGDSIECPAKEFRAATASRKKGIIADMPARLEPGKISFDVTFTPLGLAVLATIHGSQPV